MINYEELEDAALFGIEESFNNHGEGMADDGWFEDSEGNIIGDWQGEEIAEALYCKYLGLDA